jgi:hypothetical protein
MIWFGAGSDTGAWQLELIKNHVINNLSLTKMLGSNKEAINDTAATH